MSAAVQSAQSRSAVFIRFVGPICVAARDWWILAGLIFLGASAAVIAPIFLVDKAGKILPPVAPVLVAVGIAAAAAVVLDRIADKYDQSVQTSRLRSAEDAAEISVHNLNTLLSEAIQVAFTEKGARPVSIETLERNAARCAAQSLGDGGRASLYSMYRDTSNWRRLANPKHGLTHSRKDAPDRPFVEEEDTEHEIWTVMDRADTEAEVRSKPDEVYGVDWSKKKYVTFVSIPIKAVSVQFGLLSANSSQAGAIVGPQRATLIAMARVIALVHAFDLGPRVLAAKSREDALSDRPDTLGDQEDSNDES